MPRSFARYDRAWEERGPRSGYAGALIPPCWLDSLCGAYTGLFQLVTYDAGACSAENAALVRARDLHYLFGLTASPTLFEEARRWLGSRKTAETDDTSEDFERGCKVVRRLFLGEATAAPVGWDHLRTVLRIQTQVFELRPVSFAAKTTATSSPACPSCASPCQTGLLVGPIPSPLPIPLPRPRSLGASSTDQECPNPVEGPVEA